MILRDVLAEIDLDALRHNLTAIRQHISPTSKFCVVVKANAYGHGAVEVSKVAVECGADFLAVATVEEGLELRRTGFKVPILILGLIPYDAADFVVANDLTQAVSDFALAERLSEAAERLHKTAKIHLKLETGMGRIGIAPDKAVALAEKISRLPSVELEGMFSHFADADSKDRTFTNHQIELFKATAAKVRAAGIAIKIHHLAESAAILDIPEAHFDMVRSGIINYGLYPSADVRRTIALKPVMKLITHIAYLKKVSAGVSIGYGREFVAERDSLIATLPIGYADGYIRAYKGFHVEVKGKGLAPIAGRVCMDQTMIDVTDLDGVKLGDEVILFGSDLISADDAARHLNTINYEIICLISARVPRVFKSDNLLVI